jgi:signal recognition particle subunit SRP54
MFETLTDRLNGVFSRLSGKGRITEGDVDDALREIRRALLEADVNLQVVRDLQSRIRERAVGTDVLQSVTPAQQIVKIVHEELTTLLGSEKRDLGAGNHERPIPVLLVGLQGSGKTTTAGKLAAHLKAQGRSVMLAAADLRRPAAIQQLATLGSQVDVPVHQETGATDARALVKNALKAAKERQADYLLIDTGGRLQIDEELMKEMADIRRDVNAAEVVLVVDAMTGQDAVNVAQEFHRQVPLTGLILTKMDGDARGGAALSIVSVTGLPVYFIGTGERSDGLELFHPDRLAGRILGMGDVVSLVEKAQQTVDIDKAKEMERKLRNASFTLEDFLDQLNQVKQMGPLSNLLEMIPGFSSMQKNLPAGGVDEAGMQSVEAIILSMTPDERRRPEIIGGSRRRRIARGSGTAPADVNRLLNQFDQMRKMMKQFAGGGGGKGKMPRMPFPMR